MFNKVLIANRGAIAVRIIRTLQTMGITSVAVYAQADRDSLHVRQADEAYCLGDGSAQQTYLNQDKLFAIIAQSGAQAVHPGYGFLSENPEFVRRCEDQGISFIGPRAQQIEAFGLKHEARALAQASQVPLVPGSELLTSLEEAISVAQQIGYPVMLKSTAGGGGIGMRVCDNEQTLVDAFDSVKRLSANNFSNDGLFLEKYIASARHIEVQVFGDGKGQAIALGERDCSSQRRHQKVIEETPAPGLDDATRTQLHQSACRLVAAVDYRNAGTVEFIYDVASGAFYFLEVNTRLQVEHGVTEQVFGVDLVQWMLEQAADELDDLVQRGQKLAPKGHAIQARIYAEDPNQNFQPSAGLLTTVELPATNEQLRIDHWLSPGLEVPAIFDPLLAKVIVWRDNREQAIAGLLDGLDQILLQGIETNLDYAKTILKSDCFAEGKVDTGFLNTLPFHPATFDVISPGTQTTLQDHPGRLGFWHVGIPPSGPFDNYSFRLGNRLLGNPEAAAGLEIVVQGPRLRFNRTTTLVITGAEIAAELLTPNDSGFNKQTITCWQPFQVEAGQQLTLGAIKQAGARAYLLIAGGVDGHCYLNSRATFTLGQFGGFSGRALRTGDVLHLANPDHQSQAQSLPAALKPQIQHQWQLRVIYGPHGAPDFFTETDIDNLFSAEWEVHYNSSRTGVRLIGPKPQWARSSGGEAGMHPSNIHDNAYAIGSLDFTGDMPVILGPDGPSLGGFVCPATVISADLWKLGQLRPGDKIQFQAVNQETAKQLLEQQQQALTQLQPPPSMAQPSLHWSQLSPIAHQVDDLVFRPSGDGYLLVEFGPQELDLRLRFRVHELMLWLEQQPTSDSPKQAIAELTPGIRSLQIRYDHSLASLTQLIDWIVDGLEQLKQHPIDRVPSRIVHIPLSWDDPACHLAVEKYQQSVRKNAPWCPDNIEFIRRINGLDSIEQVKELVFDARYVVMGLGDVYLGAPVATPMDPRHRLVTTKYNPARTWTAENSVGIGGSYLCVYGMEGPGGYQFIGRTLQMWNRYRVTQEFSRPWLLRFFDQIQFYPVSSEELTQIREDFPRGDYPLRIEQTEFCLQQYEEFLAKNRQEINAFTERRNQAFDAELQRWIEQGQMRYEMDTAAEEQSLSSTELADNQQAVESHVAGSLWQWKIGEGDQVTEGQTLCIVESMKMEIAITATAAGEVKQLCCEQGQLLKPGQTLLILEV